MQFSFLTPLPPPPHLPPPRAHRTAQDSSNTVRQIPQSFTHHPYNPRHAALPPRPSSTTTPSASSPEHFAKMDGLDQLESDGGIQLDMLDGENYEGARAARDSKDEDGSENLDMNDYGLPMDDDDDDDDAYRGVEEAVAGVALFNEAGKRVRGRPKGTKNQPGHKAGRPKGSLLVDEIPSAKRLRDDPSPYLDAPGELASESDQRIANAALAATNAQIAAALQNLHQNPDQRDLHRLGMHGLGGDDIPVDPALTLGNARSSHSLLTMNNGMHDGPSAQSIAEASDYGRAYAMGDGMAGDQTGIAGTYFDRGGRDDSPLLGSDALNLPGGGNNRLSRAEKGKGIAVVEEEAPGLEGEIRRAFKQDFGAIAPRLSGPYLLTMVNGEQHLEPTVDATAAEINPGPVYVYLANFEQARHVGPPPVAHDWKTTDPYKKDGKPRARGPRKCGHCGKASCKGRGGRSWCDQYNNGQPSTSTRRMRGTVGDEGEDEGKGEEQVFGENIMDDNSLNAGTYGQGGQHNGTSRTRMLAASASSNDSGDLLTDPNLAYNPSFVDPGLEALYDPGEVIVEEEEEMLVQKKKGKPRKNPRS